MNWYLDVLKKYAIFDGRSRRKEFWFFSLFNMIVSFGLGIIEGIIGMGLSDGGIGLLSGLYTLAVLVPSIAVSIRRLHDTNRSGWWLFIALIPLLGVLVLLFFMVQDSTPGGNTYGENPKAVTT